MSLSIIERTEEKVMEVQLSGKLTSVDYKQFIPETERFINAVGKISVLMIMRDFHGWDMGGIWQDIKWDFKHFNRIERIAMVGEKKWQSAMSVVCKPFTRAEIRYFTMPELEQAREWVAKAETVPA